MFATMLRLCLIAVCMLVSACGFGPGDDDALDDADSSDAGEVDADETESTDVPETLEDTPAEVDAGCADDCVQVCIDNGYDTGACADGTCFCQHEGADAGADAAEVSAAAGCADVGGWLDEASGLCWENPASPVLRTWFQAMEYCDARPGWRMPTIGELRTTIRGCPATETSGTCDATDTCLDWPRCFDASCIECEANAGPAGGMYWPDEFVGDVPEYWSSSTCTGVDENVWIVNVRHGHVHPSNRTGAGLVRCVVAPVEE